MSAIISIVIPSYNEEKNVVPLYKRLKDVATSLVNYEIEYIFVDDGSHDKTLQEIKELTHEVNNIYFIQLSRNFGHQNALKAGLDHARGDCVISMDADMQHPPEIILELIKKWEEGYEVVYTKRKEINHESWVKRKTSKWFYYFHNLLSEVKLDPGTADFRLMTRNVVDAFFQLRENELFIRGLVKWAGFKQTFIEYIPNERHNGESKYSVYKMISFALKGITSFSTRPLKLVVYVGLIFFAFSILLIPYALISYLSGNAVSGWTSIIITIFFFGSLQLLLIGIIGLYVSKLVIQTKQRPLYFIRETNYPPLKSK